MTRKLCPGCPHEDLPRSLDPYDIEVRQESKFRWEARFPWPHHKPIWLGMSRTPALISWRSHERVTAMTRQRAIRKAEAAQEDYKPQTGTAEWSPAHLGPRPKKPGPTRSVA